MARMSTGTRICTHPLRTERRKRAAARKIVSDKLTPQQKLDKLNSTNMTATRERARLQRQIAEGGKQEKKKERTLQAAQQLIEQTRKRETDFNHSVKYPQ